MQNDSGYNYIGNKDFRGWAYANPETQWVLPFMGNDGSINQEAVNNYDYVGSGYIPAPYSKEGFASGFTKGLTDTYNNYINTAGKAWGDGRTGVNGAYTSGTSNTYNPEDLSLIDNQINTANQGLGRLGNQRDIGYSNIDNSTQEARNKLAQQRGLAERDYGTQKADTGLDYANTRANVRSQAGNQFGSLQRLLGSAGAGRSSAAQVLAPFAVGKQASQRFGQVQDTFGRNQRDMDTAWGDTTRQFDEYGQDLESQREQKRRELESGINQNEVSLQDQLAQLQLQRQQAAGGRLNLGAISPMQSRIQQLLSSIDNLGRQYSGSVQAKGNVQFKAPELSQYNYSKFAAPMQNGQVDPRADYISPFTNLLNREDEERRY